MSDRKAVSRTFSSFNSFIFAEDVRENWVVNLKPKHEHCCREKKKEICVRIYMGLYIYISGGMGCDIFLMENLL